MFGVDMESVPGEVTFDTAKGLSKQYKKLTALFTVRSSGTLDGDFHLILDKEGLFILAGTIVMLPEKRITDMRRKGAQKDAEELDDAVGETGNLLVGSWDRVFREGWEQHGHFLQTGTFIGVPWENSKEVLGVEQEEEFMYIPVEMTVGEFPTFKCGVIFPEALFAEKPVVEEPPADEEAPTEAAAEETGADAAEPAATDEAAVEESAAEPAPTDDAAAEEPDAEPAVEPTAEETPASETPAEDDTSAADEQPAAAEPDEAAAPETEPEAAPEPAAESETPASETEDETAPAPAEAPQANVIDVETPAEAASVESRGAVTQSIEKMVNSFASLPGQGIEPLLKMPARDVMQTSVVWASPDDSVQQALTKMQETDSGYLLVGTNGVLEGIVSWVDLIGAISIYLKPIFAKWRRPADDATLQIRLKVIMTRPVRTAKLETTLAVIMENMCQHGLRCLPIIDAQAGVQGMVTAFDIFKIMLNTNPDIVTLGQTPPGALV